ncbi:MAG TPA: hypothetical protein VII52_02395, partial [Gemmatimonadaceae bacterium]
DSWAGLMAGLEDKPSTAAKDEADQYFEKGCPGVRFGAVDLAPAARVASAPTAATDAIVSRLATSGPRI